jgi:hypothetical protein
MGPNGRIEFFIENHIGFGIRWEKDIYYPWQISLSVMMLTVSVGLGKRLV